MNDPTSRPDTYPPETFLVRHVPTVAAHVLAMLLLVVLFLAATSTAQAQIPVIDRGMFSRNLIQTGQQVTERLHEADRLRLIRHLLRDITLPYVRDLDAEVRRLEAPWHTTSILAPGGFDPDADLETVYPGYAGPMDGAELRAVRYRSLDATHKALVETLSRHQEGWEGSMRRLQLLQAAIGAHTHASSPLGEGSRQALLQLRVHVRLAAEEELALFHHALVQRSHLRNLARAAGVHEAGAELHLLEQLLGQSP